MTIMDNENTMGRRPGTADAVWYAGDSPNTLDLGHDGRDLGRGTIPIKVSALVRTVGGGGGATTEVIIETDDNDGFTSSTIVLSAVIGAAPAVGRIVGLDGVNIPPGQLERYVRGTFTGTALTSGDIELSLNLDQQQGVEATLASQDAAKVS
jgi:hypothetical protein